MSEGNERKLLLVEDDEALLRGTARTLASEGYRITCAASGDEALGYLSRETYDAIVSDIRMPGMNGIQLLRAAREHDADVQIVLVTGNPDVASASAAVEYGAFQYLVKPVDAALLRATVQRAIDATHATRLKREFVEQFGSGTFRVGDRAGVDSALDRALGSLSMAYQPIVRTATQEIFAYEALVRTRERALPEPADLLSAARRVGRLHDVGRAVRDRVATDLSELKSSDVCVFVNLHADDLLDPALYSEHGALSAFATRIIFDLTERESLEQISDASRRVADLRALGFRFALDDLGAGYAGLSSFAQLEPEFVKLDISVIRDIHENLTKRRLAQSMIDLCHDMSKQVIAEGVEAHAEKTVLEDLGCDLMQGHLVAAPAFDLAVMASRGMKQAL